MTIFATFSVIEAQGFLQGERQPGTAAESIRKTAKTKGKRGLEIVCNHELACKRNLIKS